MWALVIFVLMSLPNAVLPPTDFFFLFEPDKIAHAGVFFIMMSTYWLYLRTKAVQPAKRHYTIPRAFLGCVMYGGILELWQRLLPYRSAEWMDFVADSIGAFIAGIFLTLFLRQIERVLRIPPRAYVEELG